MGDLSAMCSKTSRQPTVSAKSTCKGKLVGMRQPEMPIHLTNNPKRAPQKSQHAAACATTRFAMDHHAETGLVRKCSSRCVIRIVNDNSPKLHRASCRDSIDSWKLPILADKVQSSSPADVYAAHTSSARQLSRDAI